MTSDSEQPNTEQSNFHSAMSTSQAPCGDEAVEAAPKETCDRAEISVARAVACGWITGNASGLEQLKKTIRIALDMEVEAGGPYLCGPVKGQA